MFKNEDEKRARFREMTEIMETASQKRPPDNFTSGVMTRIYTENETSRTFSFRRLFETNLNFGFRDYVTKKECAFYFLLTGFFYLVLGVILMLGLRPPAVWLHNGWLSFQPLFGLIIAVELALLGMTVYTNGDISVRFVRAGTLIYAALIILDGCAGAYFIRIPVAAFLAVIFSITGLGTAFLLGLAVSRYYPETISSEVRG
ncbi:MAG: hypothetical protein ABSC11_02595 [Smithella sp.]|jgi:hypothetical protein